MEATAGLMGRRAKSPTGKANAKRPLARTPENEGPRVRDLEKRLAEALEQQAATAEILEVIASSPTDALPTFQAIARAATRLCSARDTGVIRFDGTLLHLMANEGFTTEERDALRAQFPRSADRTTVTGRAILTRAVAHVADITQDSDYGAPTLLFMRAVLSVPMLRDGQPIGAITVTRHEAKPFSPSQITLLETFARQAVIAIENVRSFTETKEALDRQTATSEILRVISRSPTDVQPVFDKIAESAARLCDAFDVTIFRLDGGRLRLVAHHGPMPVGALGDFSLPVSRETVGGRSVIDAVTLNLEDVEADADEFPEGARHARRFGHRAMLSVPLTRDGAAIGVIHLRRTEPGRFTDRQVALLQTFADQAVIAIENVRLFTELEERNQALTHAHA
jgi:two-component system NtrC family sensor kinase